MAIVKRTSKNQISLPKALLQQLPPCDYFEVDIEGGALVLRPVKIVNFESTRPKSAPSRRLADLVGSGTGLFKTAQEVETYLDALRNEWDQ